MPNRAVKQSAVKVSDWNWS